MSDEIGGFQRRPPASARSRVFRNSHLSNGLTNDRSAHEGSASRIGQGASRAAVGLRRQQEAASVTRPPARGPRRKSGRHRRPRQLIGLSSFLPDVDLCRCRGCWRRVTHARATQLSGGRFARQPSRASRGDGTTWRDSRDWSESRSLRRTRSRIGPNIARSIRTGWRLSASRRAARFESGETTRSSRCTRFRKRARSQTT